jgi:hypothetical protein
VLIRTNFTYAKQLNGQASPDSTINVGWLYEQFQKLCKNEIDRELVTAQQQRVVELLARNVTVAQLNNMVQYLLQARNTLTADEKAAKQREFKNAVSQAVPEDLTKLLLGQMILEVGGVQLIDGLIGVSSTTPPQAAPKPTTPVASEPTKEDAIKQLNALPIDELKKLATEAFASNDTKKGTIDAFYKLDKLGEVEKKESMATYLVNEIGAKAAIDLIPKKE